MFAEIIFNVIGALIFLFIFWRRLKEDYLGTHIFTTGFYMLGGLLLGLFLSKRFFAPWWFWAAFIGAGLGLALGVLRFKLRFFESLEAAVAGLLPWIGIVYLSDSIQRSSLDSFIGFIVLVLLIALFIFLDAHYKKFAWYKSGRIGFTGLTTLGVFLLLRAAVAPVFIDMLSFVGKQEAIISGVLAFVSFLLVFNLARKQI